MVHHLFSRLSQYDKSKADSSNVRASTASPFTINSSMPPSAVAAPASSSSLAASVVAGTMSASTVSDDGSPLKTQLHRTTVSIDGDNQQNIAAAVAAHSAPPVAAAPTSSPAVAVVAEDAASAAAAASASIAALQRTNARGVRFTQDQDAEDTIALVRS
jgi:hypothetical protein